MNEISTSSNGDMKTRLLDIFSNRFNYIREFELPRVEEFYRERAKDIIRDVITTNWQYPVTQTIWDKYLQFYYEDGFEWMTNRGKYTKRLLRAVPELNPFAGYIGNQLTRLAYFSYVPIWRLSLTNKIFFEDGEFGHSGSCWFREGGYPKSRYYWEQHGGLGLLWHGENDDWNTGIGRVWILPLIDEFNIDGLALINQYGTVNHQSLRIENTASFLAKILGKSQSVYSDFYSSGSYPYVNGSRAWYIVPNDYTGMLGLSIAWNDTSIDICYECDSIYDRHDGREHPEHCDKWICDDCLTDKFTDCCECNNWVRIEDAIDVDGDLYCEYCFRDKYQYCDDCNQILLKRDVVYYRNRDLCHDCYMTRHANS